MLKMNYYYNFYIKKDYSVLSDFEIMIGAMKAAEKIISNKSLNNSSNKYIEECNDFIKISPNEIWISVGRFYGFVRRKDSNKFIKMYIMKDKVL
jgi:hypothetical protein